ncbi:hypothetical protein ISF_04949 [Cordyceps fumosorosea ARSEF 2679]|uniref:Uncharacterized protein n=1 Tax=Cordyceps fumosorosea (strain ARSEF 2679) TaxID=1081104 RepID=A0A167VX14_CORFA|nr:hypothetical protein ISF_04949 [Cordyceps fumosorosea ARSEF 2679]OAA63073.1 hypothetical protein ISF_04949 [Cordyceps fumosorosea ARSEF 2679]
MSSPGGGFYKYRCKYFFTFECKNWVWVNDTPCSTCLAMGRDDEPYPASTLAAPRDIMAPHVNNGVLQYAHMEVAVSDQGEESLIFFRSKALRPPPAMPVTTMMPRAGTLMASAH